MLIYLIRNLYLRNRFSTKIPLYRFTVLIYILLTLGTNNTAPAGEYGYWDTALVKLTYARLDYRVTHMALDIRDIPIHPQDDTIPREHAGVIKKTEYSSATWFSLDFMLMKQLDKIDLGLGFSWILYPFYVFYDNELRNYTNAVGTEKRGDDEALTFVGIGTRGVIPHGDKLGAFNLLWNVTPQFTLEIPIKSRNAALGLSVSYHRLEAVNGWDRYNKLQVQHRYNMADIYPVSIYTKLYNFRLGMRYNCVQKTIRGQNSGVKIGVLNYTVSFIQSW